MQKAGSLKILIKLTNLVWLIKGKKGRENKNDRYQVWKIGHNYRDKEKILYKTLLANKFDNLDEVNKFLENQYVCIYV